MLCCWLLLPLVAMGNCFGSSVPKVGAVKAMAAHAHHAHPQGNMSQTRAFSPSLYISSLVLLLRGTSCSCLFNLCDPFAVAMAKRVMAASSAAHHQAPASQVVPGKSPPSTATTGTGSKRPAAGGAATSGDGGSEPSRHQLDDGRILEVPNLRVFTFAELRAATRNFKPDTVLGEGGFGRVHKGWVDERTMSPARNGAGVPVAVKKLNPESLQGVQEWQVRNALILAMMKPSPSLLFLHDDDCNSAYIFLVIIN